MKKILTPMIALTFCLTTAQANLVVKVNEPKTTGSKAVIKLEMKNEFTEKIESARAVVFLLDEQSKVVGQSTKWVIGGTKDRPALEPDKKATFNFVIPLRNASSTKLTAKVTFNRVLLDGGKSADVAKEVAVTPTK